MGPLSSHDSHGMVATALLGLFGQSSVGFLDNHGSSTRLSSPASDEFTHNKTTPLSVHTNNVTMNPFLLSHS